MHQFSDQQTQQVTQMFTYLLMQCRTACHAHIGLFTLVMTQQNVDGSDH